MREIKPTVEALFFAKLSAANIENKLDDIGISLQPFEDMDRLTSLPINLFCDLFTVNGACIGKVQSDFIDMPHFDKFWKLHGASLMWRDAE